MMSKRNRYFKRSFLNLAFLASMAITGCAQVDVPNPRTVDIDAPTRANARQKTINEGYEPVVYVPLGSDVLIPKSTKTDTLPDDIVGPLELRNETLALALQLILDDYDIPIAFETDLAFSQTVTVSKLKGSVTTVVNKICSVANLYCAYDDGILTVKDLETFSVTLPPLGDEQLFNDIASGLYAILGGDAQPVVDPSTRTIIYSTTNRNARKASEYFEKLRSNTALIVFETYIWEVSLSGANTSGIRWDQIEDFGAFGGFSTGISLTGAPDLNVGSPISIGLPTGTGNVNLDTGDVLQFLSSQGNVKTISQPQVTVLSGSEATLRVAETQNYIESLTRTTDEDGDETVSTTTGTVDSGFTLTIGSSWDQATVYGNIEIELDEFLGFQNFDAGDDNTLQLPRTSERDLTTQVRVRPGDSVLIAGLVTESDNFSTTGPGTSRPLIPTSRAASTENTELVFLLRPRVIAYVPEKDQKSVQAALRERETRSAGTPQSADDTDAPEYTARRISAAPTPAPTAIAAPKPAPVAQEPTPSFVAADKASAPTKLSTSPSPSQQDNRPVVEPFAQRRTVPTQSVSVTAPAPSEAPVTNSDPIGSSIPFFMLNPGETGQ